MQNIVPKAVGDPRFDRLVGAPALGEHNDEVLGGILGLDADAVEQLRADGDRGMTSREAKTGESLAEDYRQAGFQQPARVRGEPGPGGDRLLPGLPGPGVAAVRRGGGRPSVVPTGAHRGPDGGGFRSCTPRSSGTSREGADGGIFFRKVGALECFVRGNPLSAYGEGLAPADGRGRGGQAVRLELLRKRRWPRR